MAALTFREALAAIQKGAPERTAPGKRPADEIVRIAKAKPLADFEGEALRAEFVRRASAAYPDLNEADALRAYAALHREDYLLYVLAAPAATLATISRRAAAQAEPMIEDYQVVEQGFDGAIGSMTSIMVEDGVDPAEAYRKVCQLPGSCGGWYADRRRAIDEAKRGVPVAGLLKRAAWWASFCNELAARARSEIRKSGARLTHQQVLERLLTRGPLGGGRVA